MPSTDHLYRTPLYEEHLALNARLVPFGGWEMPLQYEGILSEYQHTRNAAALFDISHMGEFIIEGDCKEIGLDRIITMNIVDIPVQSCRYGAMLNENGGTIDDLIVFRLGENKWFIVVNGATTQKDSEHIQKNLNRGGKFTDVTFQTGKLDIQGPQSREVLKKFVEGIEKLDYFTFDHFDLLGENVLISRTGYTGELGYEIYYPWDKTKDLWQELMKESQVKPAGLGARDVLRLEVGYSLYGHELSEDISVLEAGLSRFIDFDKEFIGKEALLRQKKSGVKRKIVGFTSETRRSPRENHKIYSQENEEIGTVSSGTFSPYLNQGIGLGFISVDSAGRGDKIFFGDQRSKNPAVISGKMFYEEGSLKN